MSPENSYPLNCAPVVLHLNFKPGTATVQDGHSSCAVFFILIYLLAPDLPYKILMHI